MKMTGLLSRRAHDLPGVTGTVRRLHPGAPVPRRLGPKDIVLTDLNRTGVEAAETLVAAEVAAVVHTPREGEEMLPRGAYRILAGSTVPVLEHVEVADEAGDDDALEALGDGARIRIDGGVVYKGLDEVASGRRIESSELLAELDDAEAVYIDNALAHMANATEFLSLEHPLLLDGEGVPEIEGLDFAGRHVVVVTSDEDAERQLADLKPFLKEYRPLVIGVDGGGDVLRAAKVSADLLVATPTEVADATLTDGVPLVVPADRDGRCEGLERLHALGVGATTFPAAATARDLALLLAHHGGAEMIVVTGDDAGLEGAFGPDSAPSSTVVDRALASKLVHARACATLYRSKGSGVALALVVLAALAAVAAIVLVRGSGPEILSWAVDTWNSFALWVQGLVR